MHEDNYTNENPPSRNRAIDPETAASDIRAILAASGESESFFAQQRALHTWAENQDRLLDPRRYLTPARDGGLEHRIWLDEAEGNVLKVTYGGCFGRIIRNLRTGLGPATPLEYLDRWHAHNALFGRITFFVGVVPTPECPQVVIEQQALAGELPSSNQIEVFMRECGFQKLEAHPFAWKSDELRFMVFDARPANYVLIEDTPVPFDLIPVPYKKLSAFSSAQ